MEDWSLQAIVRGSSGDFSEIKFDHMEMNGHDPFSNDQFDVEFLTNFHEIFDMQTNDELIELYKPFCTTASNNDHDHSLPAQTVLDFQGPENKPTHDSDQSTGTSCVGTVTTTTNYTPKYKKRKNQLKRVVIQVSADGLASDMWAWRKYGQKPIKGSPFPRSYYRCSSSKGCLARKQVEQSCTEQGMFIVTYTAEHSHSQPTRRNSLAGTVRQKFPSHKNTINNRNKTVIIAPQKPQESCSPTSPTTLHRPLMSDQVNNNNNNNGEERVIKGEINDDYDNCIDYIMSDEFVLNDDFFSGIEDDRRFVGEQPICDDYERQRSCSWF